MSSSPSSRWWKGRTMTTESAPALVKKHSNQRGSAATGLTSRRRKRRRQAKSIVRCADPFRGPFLSLSQTFNKWAGGDREVSYSKCVRFIASASSSLHTFSQQSKILDTVPYQARRSPHSRQHHRNQVHLSLLLSRLLSLRLGV